MRLAAGCVHYPRHVGMGENRVDARQLAGRSGIDALYARMGNGAREQCAVQHSRQLNVIREHRPSFG